MQLFSKDAFAFREQLQNLKKVQSICLCGLFVAAYVALSFFSIKMTEFLEFRFAFLALAAAAAYGGPVMGMAAGLTGDVISFFAAPQTGPFFPGFTISLCAPGLPLRNDPLPLKDHASARIRGRAGGVHHCLYAQHPVASFYVRHGMGISLHHPPH